MQPDVNIQLDYTSFLTLLILLTITNYMLCWWLFFRNPGMTVALHPPFVNTINDTPLMTMFSGLE
jgi:hypothetical protein